MEHNDLRGTYNRIAKDWARDHADDSWWKKGADAFIARLTQEDAVLDVGCGAGMKSAYLAAHGLRVTGIDFSEEMITLARAAVPDSAFFVMDMRDLSQLQGTFSGVFAHAALLHIPKKEVLDVLGELAGKLKPRGYLYIAVKGARPGQQEEEIVAENDYGYEYKRFFSYFMLDELKRHITAMDMEVVYESSTPSGKTVWLQVIARK